MSEQKVVICKDLKSELQDFLSSLKYDKLFILMDTNTKEKCFPYGQLCRMRGLPVTPCW